MADDAKKQVLDEQTQKQLGAPITDSSSSSDKNQVFLADVIKKIDQGKINLMVPNSLINNEIYEKLPSNLKGEVDINATIILARLRDIKGLYDIKAVDSYQMENLIEAVRLSKERIENDKGDVFII